MVLTGVIKKESVINIWTLFKKELWSYFNSPIAYIFIAVFLVAGNWLFFNSFFVIGQASLRGYFSFLPWMFLFLAPALTMRLWAEEKKSGTIEFLLTLPITDMEAVLAKFFGALTFLFFTLILSVSLPVSIAILGNVDAGPIIGGYLGGLFLGGAYLSLGLFISSLTRNQIIAFVLGLAACFSAFVVGADFAVSSAPQFLQPAMQFLGLGSHFFNISKGVIDSRDIIYYLSFMFLFLWLNAKVIETRK
jgi:ABC-2 type transport system permease protein